MTADDWRSADYEHLGDGTAHSHSYLRVGAQGLSTRVVRVHTHDGGRTTHYHRSVDEPEIVEEGSP